MRSPYDKRGEDAPKTIAQQEGRTAMEVEEEMETERKDAIREANRRRAGCPACGNAHARELTAEEKARRDDTFPELRYRTCPSCGHTWRAKGKA